MIKKINSLLEKKEKIALGGLLLLAILGAFLDLIGISSILPIVSLISSPETAMNDSFILRLLSNVFNTTNSDTLFTISLVFVLIIFLLKAIHSIGYAYILRRVAYNYARKMTRKLMDTYLSLPYEYHLNNNSSTLIRKSVYDVDNFIQTITEMLSLIIKVLTIVVISTYLLIMNYKITLIVIAILFVFSLLVIFVLKPQTKKLSKEAQVLNNNNYKFLSQAFSGIKETKISNTEKYFSSQYDENRENINNILLKRYLINSIPANLIELVGMLGLVLSLVIIKLSNATSVVIVETFAIFVYAIMKLLPNVTGLTTIINSFSFYKISVDSVYNDINENKEYLKSLNEESDEKIEFNDSIKVNDVSFAYSSNKETIVLKDVNLEIKKNTSVAICGITGSGKTTLLDIILGLLTPDKGSVTMDGINIKGRIKGIRKNFSYIPQTIYLSDDTIRNNVAFGLKEEDISDEKVLEALKHAELDEFVLSLPNGINTVVGERGVRLSGGQRQRIGIARAFYRDTNIIVFDEATSSLDYETEANILSYINKNSNNHTLIIVTHRLNTIDTCDVIYKVEDNKVSKIK